MARFLEIAAAKKRGLNWDAVRDVPHPGVEVYDMTNLPMKGIADNTYDGAYSEHFIEHLYKYQGINFLKEMLRVLKPGGILRTVWPAHEIIEWLVGNEDLSKHPFVQHYYQVYVQKHKFPPPGNEHRRIQEQVALGLLHQKGEHLYVWGKQELMDTLKQLGYSDIKERPYGKSVLPDFNNIDTPGQIRAMHSAVVEARKPW